MGKSDVMVKSPRLDATFAKCRAEHRAALSVFISAGDPDAETSLALLQALPAAGADIIELGMPFTDPVGDGPSVQAAGQRALRAGIKLATIFEMVQAFRRQDSDTPIVLMGYYNTVYAHGNERFLARAQEVGADALIMVDLPPEEDSELWQAAIERGVTPIRFVAPTTSEQRFSTVLRNVGGFLYLIALEGVTGAGLANDGSVAERIANVRRFSDVPIAVGFGIKQVADVARMSQWGDAVIVGSAVVDTIRGSLSPEGRGTERTVPAVVKLVSELRTGVAKRR